MSLPRSLPPNAVIGGRESSQERQRHTARAADGHEVAVTRFPAQGHAWATLVVAGWCLHSDYLVSEEGARAAFARVAAPILGYSFEDDEMITRTAVDNLPGFYAAAAVDRGVARENR